MLSHSKNLVATITLAMPIFVIGCQNDVNNGKNNHNDVNQQVKTQTNAITTANSDNLQTPIDNNRQSLSHTTCNNSAIYQAFKEKNLKNKRQVLGCGEIVKVLKDDNEGARHQKFLVKVDNYPNVTVLIAHNIDLAPRVANIQTNTPILFYGEYIYNDKGGVVHWTHRDPASRHQDGWLDYQGQRYQ